MTNTDQLVVEVHNKPLWVINYKDFYPGEVARDEHENEVPYFHAFSDNDCALITLESYIMGIMKTADCTYMLDCHARNCFGMPDPNDSAVVMKFADISERNIYVLFHLN